MTSHQPPHFSIHPLIPLPPTTSTNDERPSSPSSPFSSLFNSPPSLVSTVPRPLFPNQAQMITTITPPPLQVIAQSPPADESSNSAFGEFVSSDPLQGNPSWSPSKPLSMSSKTGFVQEAAERHKARGAKVMAELIGRDDDDPLGWLGGPSDDAVAAKPFDDWDGMEDALDEEEKERELQDEIADHNKLPHTPHASRRESPKPSAQHDEEYNSDEDIIDLKTGQRGRHAGKSAYNAARPIPISRSKPFSQPHQPSNTSSGGSSSYLGFTIPRKWFSGAGPSPPTISTSIPPAGITRQSSVGEFTYLPPADLTPYGTLEKPSPKPAISFFDISGPLPSPFAKKAYLPPTGAPAFVPDDNWNPSCFEYDSQSKRDTMGSEKLNLVGRSETTITVLSQTVADTIRPNLPPLPRLARTWSLLYSTDQHGMSIGTLYKNVERFYGQPGGCVLAIREASNSADGDVTTPPCFGVWVGTGLRCLDGHYYGSGESFLWKTRISGPGQNFKGVKVFKWTGRNDYVALCENDSLSFGGGDGKYGLYMDSAFVDGTSERCDTFANEVLCGDSDVEGRARFECLALEVWRVGGP